jgi:non-ribosomal peptide synthetase component E (peptide arylation enzyme)
MIRSRTGAERPYGATPPKGAAVRMIRYRKGGGIRRNGDFINPGFVEAALAADPQVTDVYVYGIPSSNGAPGEKEVVAAIVVDRSRFDPASLFAACRRSLEPNFVPSFLQVVDEIPKTASEKPQDRFLVEALLMPSAEVYQYKDGLVTKAGPAQTGNAENARQRSARA